VLTIAHRLNTVMDSDRVLVMDAGTMVEFDHPHNLLINENGFFYRMVEQTGDQSSSDALRGLALEASTGFEVIVVTTERIVFIDSNIVVLKHFTELQQQDGRGDGTPNEIVTRKRRQCESSSVGVRPFPRWYDVQTIFFSSYRK